MTSGQQELLDLGVPGLFLTVWDAEVAASYTERNDGGARSKNRHKLLPVWQHARCDNESIDLGRDLQLFRIFCGNELFRAQLERLILLPVRAGEHNDVATHFSGKLDRQMACKQQPVRA